MQKDMTRRLIETSVRGALARCQQSHGRAVRNLVDLGLNFSRGKLKKRLLTTIQTMLCNPDSAYYELVRDTVAHVDNERLLRFGVNLGYEGCTKGARKIRAIEAENGFNVPWALSLTVDGGLAGPAAKRYREIVRQGRGLGIHTFLLNAADDPAPMAALPETAEDGAFVLFLESGQVTGGLIERLRDVPNILAAVHAGPGAQQACARLRAAGYPYAVWGQYADPAPILSGQWLESVLPLHPILALLCPAKSCAGEQQRAVGDYVRAVRERQQYPVVAMELKQDLLWIDDIISEDREAAYFDRCGDLHTVDGDGYGLGCNLFSADLQDIFRRALPHAAAAR